MIILLALSSHSMDRLAFPREGLSVHADLSFMLFDLLSLFVDLFVGYTLWVSIKMVAPACIDIGDPVGT